MTSLSVDVAEPIKSSRQRGRAVAAGSAQDGEEELEKGRLQVSQWKRCKSHNGYCVRKAYLIALLESKRLHQLSPSACTYMVAYLGE